MISKSVRGLLTSIMQEILTSTVYDGVCLHNVPSTGELALNFLVYICFADNKSKVYGHDRGYKGGHLASRVA